MNQGLSILITAHKEGFMAGPTLNSVLDACSSLLSNELCFEIIVGLDNPSQDTANFVFENRPIFSHIVNCSLADQGLVRNKLASYAKYNFIALVDADDLISPNWFSSSMDYFLSNPSLFHERIKNVAHPELNIIFEGSSFSYSSPSSFELIYSKNYQVLTNYYDAMMIMHRSILECHPFPARNIKRGYACEDWQWNIEVSGLGINHIVIPDTLIYKRRRASSQSHFARAASAMIQPIDDLSIINLINL